MSPIPSSSAMEVWISMPEVRRRKSMVHQQRRASLCSMPAPDLSDVRYNFPGDYKTPSSMVPCDVAHNQSEIRGQRIGTSEGAGIGQLSDSVGVASQNEACYYLDEYTFRFNRRNSNSRGLLFYRLLEQAVQTDPTPYTTMIGGRRFPLET